MAVEKQFFGKTPKGEEVSLYILSNSNGMKAAVSDFGAALVRLMVPDRQGNPADVVLGFDSLEEYLENPPSFGIVVGPNANRIAGASFVLDGEICQLVANENGNNLHSSKTEGYQKQLWTARTDDNCVTFSLEDADGNLGFPGNKYVEVSYSLDQENGLTLSYYAKSDKRTVLNLTNHTYFNLEGHNCGSMEEHELQLFASHYTPVAAGAIPTGEIAPVKGTPMDFTQPKAIGRDIKEDFEQLKLTGGYDHNWVIDGWDGNLRLFAVVKAPESGRVMKAYTTLPGVQFYAGNGLKGLPGKQGAVYHKHQGLCLETQYYPDTVHHPDFPSCIFGGEGSEAREYRSVTVYRFE